MTTGSKVYDRRPYSYYVKNWSGTNYSGSVANVFQSYWKKVEAAAHTEAGRPKLPYSYLRIWEERRKPRRSTLVDHPYHMDLTFYTDDQNWRYDEYDIYVPHAFLGTVDHPNRFVQMYGTGQQATPLWNANDTIALQGKLREKIVGSDFDMGVFLGEGRETLSLIAQSAHRLYDAYRSVRRCDAAGIAKALGASPARVRDIVRRNQGSSPNIAVSASQAWLELQYGWMPMVKDAEGAAQALAQQLNEPCVQTYRVRMKKPMSLRKNGGGNPSINVWFEEAFTRAQLIARVKEVNVAALNGLADPSSVAWELTPWSFVADWFIPIGNYLSARGLASAVEGTFVTTITHKSMWECTGSWPALVYKVPVNKPNYKELHLVVDRTVSSSLQTPKPQFKRLGEVLSWKRAANAVALLVTNFSGGASKQPLSRAWGERTFRSRPWRGGNE